MARLVEGGGTGSGDKAREAIARPLHLNVVDKLRQLAALPAVVERRLGALEVGMGKILDELAHTEAVVRQGLTEPPREEAMTHATERLEDRVEDLHATLQKWLDISSPAAEARHASLWQLLTDQHNELVRILTERSEELTALVKHLRFLVADGRTSAPTTTSSSTELPPPNLQARAMAAAVRDFLGVTTDEDPPAVRRRAGSVELDLPAWDKVVAPWLEEYKEWEPEVTKALTDLVLPGSTILDVGAHVGIFTLLAARLVGPTGKVIALEPDPLNARFLRRNVMRYGLRNVLVLETAAADRTCTLPLSRPATDNTGDSRVYNLPLSRDHLFVGAVAIDDLLPLSCQVDLVKLDLQGMDHIALRGMQQLLLAQRPLVILELWPEGIRAYGDSPPDVVRSLRNLGYSWQALELPELTDACAEDEVCAAVENYSNGYVNLFLKPLPNNPGRWQPGPPEGTPPTP